MYDRLRSVINSKVSDIQKGSSEKLGPDLLKYYEQSWHNFKISIKTMNGVSSYLNKHWVSREREGLFPIFSLFFFLNKLSFSGTKNRTWGWCAKFYLWNLQSWPNRMAKRHVSETWKDFRMRLKANRGVQTTRTTFFYN